VVPGRLLSVDCRSCGAALTLIVEHEGGTLMMQAWTCVACRASNDAVFTRRIKQVTRRIDRGQRGDPSSLEL